MSPIFVAIDTPDLGRALELAAAVRRQRRRHQARPRILRRQRPGGSRRDRQLGLPIFLDLKLHDIPNTVAKAVRALRRSSRRSSPSTPPAARAMLEQAKAAAPERPRWSR